MGSGSLALLDYRRAVSALYAEVRASVGPADEVWRRWRHRRDSLFLEHSQSPILREQRSGFRGLEYYSYNPELRFEVKLEPSEEQGQLGVELNQDGVLKLQRLGAVNFEVGDRPVVLSLFWLMGYGGGLFLPFRDATNGTGTYGGGRYLLDTVKGADLGGHDQQLLLDFNYAYNPSCAYDPAWHCPLAPPENWLEVPLRAGEKDYRQATGVEPDASAIPQAI